LYIFIVAETYFLLDECFLEFTENGVSLLSDCQKYPHLILLRAFTKLYAMPGLRLGYAINADKKLRKAIERMLQPWNVSLPAQMAGIAAIKETDFLTKTRQALKKEKVYLLTGLQTLKDRNPSFISEIYGSDANFIFFSGEKELALKLKQNGILIRDCSNYRGLSKGDFRICIKKKEKNQRLLQTMEVLENQMESK